ncbi:cadmium resistance protein CadD (predicted permease) [Kribbella aluminosa]|uniref:Cadmium resistance protein CadD (Predicted permease) n=1 Tax=Kribbella aluminosa TaxID=416017 RepID=A0ABS4UJM0_9ACTN|nr:cadmium resistance transporter [Kribbella aluminosa]MBP2351846.1 cadmium resistance protein CadD (predicted permease) [Kribbella aluminosa]
MELGLLGQAAGMFAVTNIDDMLVLAVFFGQTAGHRPAVLKVVAGQYLGFGATLAVSVVGAFGADLLPEAAIGYLGLIPLLLGVRAAWTVRHDRSTRDADATPISRGGAGVVQIAIVTFANGGDNIGVYVPVFALVGVGGMTGYIAVFLVGVAVWCAIGWFLASRPLVAKSLARSSHLVLPLVLIGIGTVILVKGHAFGL